MSEIGDELEQLRLPFEKIKFGKKLEVQGYGTVFEGEFDDRRVALKRLNITNLVHIKPKLLAEIFTISRFRQHPNLVALLGFCDEKSNEIILVYEYVSSGNLADKMRKRLTTIQRLEICLGAARGLDYLHTGVDSTTPGIIHGDIKPSKILLNSDSSSSKFEAKVSSFGLSKVVPGLVQKTVESTDPAFEVTGKVTKESDIYCFGVLLLEVLCGVSEIVDTDDYQERHVTELVPKRLEQNRLRKIVHSNIRNEIKTESLDTYAKIACQCVIKTPEERPTMAQVVEELEKALILQGGEVSPVQILGSRNGDGAPDGALAGDDPKEDGNGIVMYSDTPVKESEEDDNGIVLDSNTPEKESEAKIVNTERSIVDLMSDVAGENNGDGAPGGAVTGDDPKEDGNGIVMDSNTPVKESEEDGNGIVLDSDAPEKESEAKIVSTERSIVDMISGVAGENNGDGAPGGAVAADDPKEDGNGIVMDSDTPEKEPEVKIVSTVRRIDDLISDIAKENNGGDITPQEQSFPVPILDSKDGDIVPIKTHIEASQNDGNKADVENTNDPEKTEEITDNSDLNEKSNITEENETITTSSEPIDDDELDHLRIPYEKIKFGKKIESHSYGTVFKGEYNNQQVALKRLNITNLDRIKPKILSDILTISRFRKHPNLVALIGFCDEKSNEIILVYEYVSDGNLADKMREHLTTIQRLEICLGAARGLDYLHTGVDSSTPGIVHGDIKLSKILLNSKLEAKVSSFGLSRLLPGHVTLNPTDRDKVTKESDIYCFGVLLLEVLCGVSELVDTDDYQERHVTELVPKRLEQNMLRKIVHFDIRNEIKTESLETYAIIACRCVIKSPEERPTMAWVVEELEKALRLQGEEVSDIQILASEVTVTHDDQKVDDNGETVDPNILENELESNIVTIEENINNLISDNKLDYIGENNDNENKIEDITKQEEITHALTTRAHDSESKEETVDDSNLNEKSNLIGENDNEKNKNVSISDRLIEKIEAEEITMMQESQNSRIVESGNSVFLNVHDTEKKPELVIELKEGDFSDFKNDKLKLNEKTQEFESKRRSSTSSESSNGDGTAPSDYLLNKNPVNNITTKKTSNDSANCCSCAWWRVFTDRIASYGGLFWNKLVSFVTWIKAQFSRKHD